MHLLLISSKHNYNYNINININSICMQCKCNKQHTKKQGSNTPRRNIHKNLNLPSDMVALFSTLPSSLSSSSSSSSSSVLLPSSTISFLPGTYFICIYVCISGLLSNFSCCLFYVCMYVCISGLLSNFICCLFSSRRSSLNHLTPAPCCGLVLQIQKSVKCIGKPCLHLKSVKRRWCVVKAQKVQNLVDSAQQLEVVLYAFFPTLLYFNMTIYAFFYMVHLYVYDYGLVACRGC